MDDDVERKRRWFGLRFRMHDGVEGSGLCVMFHEFAADGPAGGERARESLWGNRVGTASDDDDNDEDREEDTEGSSTEGRGGCEAEEEVSETTHPETRRRRAREMGATINVRLVRELCEKWRRVYVICNI